MDSESVLVLSVLLRCPAERRGICRVHGGDGGESLSPMNTGYLWLSKCPSPINGRQPNIGDLREIASDPWRPPPRPGRAVDQGVPSGREPFGKPGPHLAGRRPQVRASLRKHCTKVRFHLVP